MDLPEASERALRVILGDEHPEVRAALGAFLATYRDIELIGLATSCVEAERLALERNPDVVIFGCPNPSADCLAALGRIRRARPELRVVVLTMHGELLEAARAAGADAVVVKGAPSARLLEEIRGAQTSPVGRSARIGQPRGHGHPAGGRS